MKYSNAKFAAYLATWTTGLVLVSLGRPLPLFGGFGVIIISELFTLRRSGSVARITAGFVPVIMALSLIPVLVAAAQAGAARFPLAVLTGFWLLGMAEELHSWRKRQRLI